MGNLTITDLFAGAGGSSTGAIAVPGVSVRMAANHWKLACEVHNANHPDTDHAHVDLHQEDPAYFPSTDLLWASPECTTWSQASGGRSLPAIEEGLFEDPLSDDAATRSRLLMFDVLRFVEHHRYRALIVENVVDIATQAKYRTAWRVWRDELVKLGYAFKVISLNSMHAQALGRPAPQSRDRLYVVAWRKGEREPDVEQMMRPRAYCPRCDQVTESRQAWKPNRKVGRYRQQYVYVCGAPTCGQIVEPGWLPAAAAIDWSLPGQRIGDRAKPLAEKTRRRIAAGIARYWHPIHLEAAGQTYDAADPNHRAFGDPHGYYRAWSTYDVLRTLHTDASKALAIPVEGRDGKQARTMVEPLRTQTTRLETALVVRGYGIEGGHESRMSTPVDEVLRTLTASGSQFLLTPFIAELRGGGSTARSVDDAMSTVTASGNHHGLVTPYYGTAEYARSAEEAIGTLTTHDRYGLITPSGGTWNEDVRPTDEALRALTTREAYALVMRNNGSKGDGAEMTTPIHEALRTLTTKGHQSLITPGDLEAAEAQVDDCLFRMLEPHEVAAGMAFPDDYMWDGTRRERVRLAGNAVTPPAARDLVAAVVEAITGEDVAA